MSGQDLQPDDLVMRRPHLDALPEPRLPEGYALRRFRPGDEVPWQAIYVAAFPDDPERARSKAAQLMASPIWRPERAVFACRRNQPVAVALAWEPRWDAPGAGWVHWVATHPDHRRKGLARATVTVTLNWMRDNGYHSALLLTQVYRLPAIRLYLDLGFRPHTDIAPEMPHRWAGVEADLRAAGGDGL